MPSWAGSGPDTAAASRVSVGWCGPWWPLAFSWWASASQLEGPPRGPGPHGVLTGSESCTPGHTRPHYTAANDCHHCAVVLESKNALSYSWHNRAPTPNNSTVPNIVHGCCMCYWNTCDLTAFSHRSITPMRSTELLFSHSFNYINVMSVSKTF